jgi:hypothetical protein
MNKPSCLEKPSTGCHLTAGTDLSLPALPPVRLAGKMTSDGYQPENVAWFEVLTITDSQGRRVGRDPKTIPVEVLTASGHGPRTARRILGALGDEPIDPSIRRLTELRRHCLSCAESATEVRRCAIIDSPL